MEPRKAMVPAGPELGGQADLTLAAQGSRHRLEHAGLGGWANGRGGKGLRWGGRGSPNGEISPSAPSNQPTTSLTLLRCSHVPALDSSSCPSSHRLNELTPTWTGWAGHRLPVGDLLPLNFNLPRRCCCHVGRLSQTVNSSFLPSNKCALRPLSYRYQTPRTVAVAVFRTRDNHRLACFTIRKSVCSNSPRISKYSHQSTVHRRSAELPGSSCSGAAVPSTSRPSTPTSSTAPHHRRVDLNRSLQGPHRSPHSKPIARDPLPTPAVLPARAGFRRQPPKHRRHVSRRRQGVPLGPDERGPE